ncbi:hypothetical protein GCM10009527_078610 [Actinomadura nitritigenes]
MPGRTTLTPADRTRNTKPPASTRPGSRTPAAPSENRPHAGRLAQGRARGGVLGPGVPCSARSAALGQECRARAGVPHPDGTADAAAKAMIRLTRRADSP